jgi:hypothetical protein
MAHSDDARESSGGAGASAESAAQRQIDEARERGVQSHHGEHATSLRGSGDTGGGLARPESTITRPRTSKDPDVAERPVQAEGQPE